MTKYLKEFTLVSGLFAFGWVSFAIFYIMGLNYVLYGISTLFAHFVAMILFTIGIGLMRPVDIKD
ncbi:MAG: hypothetical protein CMH91_05790 [Oceanicaulis sp.]|nr:hypothetical protein [Oceanicaulis sp.]MBG35755.1 hypothetical protein [Oceanicaulis sp.]HBU63033.1 hypothetical protein [Oceanicaulis sp.]|tara:strand:+ start:392 stop:586 length:195 start_codon:yes stop_codon:yes gene_type:complete